MLSACLVDSTPIKMQTLFVATCEVREKFSWNMETPFCQSYWAGCAFALVYLLNFSLFTPRIPALARFPLRTHHLLTHRLTSLTLYSARVWLLPWSADLGEITHCACDSYPVKNMSCVGLFKTAVPGTTDAFTLCLWLWLWFQYMGLKLLWSCIVPHCDKVVCVCICGSV